MMHPIDTTQELYCIWNHKENCWMRDASGSPAIFGKHQAQNYFIAAEMEPKRIFICEEEGLYDTHIEDLKKKWKEKGL